MVAGERTYVGIDLDVCWLDTKTVGDIGKLDRDAKVTRVHRIVTGWITSTASHFSLMEPGVEVLAPRSCHWPCMR